MRIGLNSITRTLAVLVWLAFFLCPFTGPLKAQSTEIEKQIKNTAEQGVCVVMCDYDKKRGVFEFMIVNTSETKKMYWFIAVFKSDKGETYTVQSKGNGLDCEIMNKGFKTGYGKWKLESLTVGRMLGEDFYGEEKLEKVMLPQDMRLKLMGLGR
jgi:hypothetical protein